MRLETWRRLRGEGQKLLAGRAEAQRDARKAVRDHVRGREERADGRELIRRRRAAGEALENIGVGGALHEEEGVHRAPPRDEVDVLQQADACVAEATDETDETDGPDGARRRVLGRVMR